MPRANTAKRNTVNKRFMNNTNIPHAFNKKEPVNNRLNKRQDGDLIYGRENFK